MYVIDAMAVVLLWVPLIDNRLVRTRNDCDESWSDIDTEPKRQYHIIPNLAETVKGYAKYERDTPEAAVKARAQAMALHGSPESQVRGGSPRFGEQPPWLFRRRRGCAVTVLMCDRIRA
jgi:LemA protein